MVHNTITGGSYFESTYREIAEKFDKISQNKKALINRKSDTRRNTFAVPTTQNPSTNKIREEMAQMKTDL